MALSVLFAIGALCAAVRSSFIGDRSRRLLIIRRRIGVFAFEKVYDSKDIDLVCVRSTLNGSGLYVRFKSGRSKTLTMSLGFGDALDDAAAALNEFLYVPHRG
jgi:hypothetical protein